MPTGRRDGTVSSMQEAIDEIPKPSMSFKELADMFASKGLGVRDLVWLSGNCKPPSLMPPLPPTLRAQLH